MTKYFVDWSDGAYPEIRRAGAETEEWRTLGTLAEAKAEIAENCRNRIADARAMLSRTRALRAKDIEKDQ